MLPGKARAWFLVPGGCSAERWLLDAVGKLLKSAVDGGINCWSSSEHLSPAVEILSGVAWDSLASCSS